MTTGVEPPDASPGDRQRLLLPATIPALPTLGLATFYRTSQAAGGDYYDFFALPRGRLGILIADVSGHGDAAAVLMAVTHRLAHDLPGLPEPPGRLLRHLNQQLATRHTGQCATFVTAFYGIYDPVQRELTYARAGHNPPRLRQAVDGTIIGLEGADQYPLGLVADLEFEPTRQPLRPGDQLVFYTDGITEATDQNGEMFGVERLDAVLARGHATPASFIRALMETLDQFTAGRRNDDDQTLVVAGVA